MELWRHSEFLPVAKSVYMISNIVLELLARIWGEASTFIMGFHVFYLSRVSWKPGFHSTREDEISDVFLIYYLYILLYILTLRAIQSCTCFLRCVLCCKTISQTCFMEASFFLHFCCQDVWFPFEVTACTIMPRLPWLWIIWHFFLSFF